MRLSKSGVMKSSQIATRPAGKNGRPRVSDSFRTADCRRLRTHEGDKGNRHSHRWRCIVRRSDRTRIDSCGLSINGIRLDPASYDTVIQKQMLGQVKYPRYYHYDPALDNLIRFGPAINADVAAGGVVVKYTSTYDTSTFTGTEDIWGGAWPGFHYLVLYRSGIMSFNSLELYGRSNYFAQIYNEELKNFAAALGRTDLANLLVPANQRDDTNRVRA